MEKIVGVAQLYFMPHPLLEIVQRLMAHPVQLRLHLQEMHRSRDYYLKRPIKVGDSGAFAIQTQDFPSDFTY